jgi:hypothetical protein
MCIIKLAKANWCWVNNVYSASKRTRISASFLLFQFNNSVDDDHDHVDRVITRLWSTAAKGPIVHPPGDIWAWMTMVEWYWQRKTPDSSTRALLQSYQQLSSNKAGGNGEWNNEFGLTKYSFHTSKVSLTCHKNYDMGPTALLLLRRKKKGMVQYFSLTAGF